MPEPGSDFARREIAKWEGLARDSALEPQPVLAEILAWLRANAPEAQRLAFVHGAYRTGNLIIRDDRVAAILDWELQVIGDPGVITWDYPTHTVTVVAPHAPPEAMSAADGAANDMYVEELRHFIRCVEGRESPLIDGREALRSLRLVEAAKTSARDGRWVRP